MSKIRFPENEYASRKAQKKEDLKCQICSTIFASVWNQRLHEKTFHGMHDNTSIQQLRDKFMGGGRASPTTKEISIDITRYLNFREDNIYKIYYYWR